MENPLAEFPSLLANILSTDVSVVERVVDTYVADDVEFQHPVFFTKGKAEFKKVYLGWSKHNLEFPKLIIHDIYYNPLSHRLVTDIDYQFVPFVPMGIRPQQARVITIFHLRPVRRDGKTKYLITRQEDYYPTDTIVAAVTPEPFSSLTKGLTRFLLRLQGLFLVYILGNISIMLSSVFERSGWKIQTTKKEVVIESSHSKDN